jgi:hypothetical protein
VPHCCCLHRCYTQLFIGSMHIVADSLAHLAEISWTKSGSAKLAGDANGPKPRWGHCTMSFCSWVDSSMRQTTYRNRERQRRFKVYTSKAFCSCLAVQSCFQKYPHGEHALGAPCMILDFRCGTDLLGIIRLWKSSLH